MASEYQWSCPVCGKISGFAKLEDGEIKATCHCGHVYTVEKKQAALFEVQR